MQGCVGIWIWDFGLRAGVRDKALVQVRSGSDRGRASVLLGVRVGAS